MKNIWTIFKKEWDRVIHDRRLVISVMLLPGLMIFLIYSFMGGAIENFTTEDAVNVAILNNTTGFEAIYEVAENPEIIQIQPITDTETASYRELVDQEEWHLVIEFSPDFDLYSGGVNKPSVTLYYNPNDPDSSSIFARFQGYLITYQNSLAYELYGDTRYFILETTFTPVDPNQMMGLIFSSLLPMLTIMFLFSGAMSIGPESIAGEKERGTIATLLVTPVKRSHIAIGKVLSLSVLSLMSSLSSFIGIIVSLPKMLAYENLDVSIYGVGDYLMLLLVLFSTVFVIVGIISILSAYAKNLKEAGTLITLIYLVVIIVSITSFFSQGAQNNSLLYLIPIYNSVQTMTAILSFDPAVVTYLLITFASNLLYTIIFIFILNQMFESERIMFAK
ncbi:MAG: ABC transporter permease subunit [Candidatus Izemoplasmatales bacterium]|jgi:sodium transport system permease protein|nr:ABC transporter permease subunit [Candidatus Izemoplasmatales bacterium]MDD4355012.1 ABC transporter permease subunit [Candidatus Izemoplasmatales bacterium]MDD4988153.1 ABC transporter permease subunit [Candidatus Izemoplasmatales bacterium]MDD5601752.1 ABC transporter permease subunit [Candidatus Izemoplasmatales bacterium]MDY0373145.1 ABC transporter permease subunit [Candidatus Izemoplasmatales bacterium]